MSKLVVISDTNCLGYLRSKGFCPSDFYTNIEVFRDHSMFFECATVVMLLGGCRFTKKVVAEMITTLSGRASDPDDTAIEDFIVISNEILPHCSDYFLFSDSPLRCIRHSGFKATSKEINLMDLEFEYSAITNTYLTSEDYGFNVGALNSIRTQRETHEGIISLIKVPTFE